MRFYKELYSDRLIEEMLPLWAAHHQEIADGSYGPLEPDLLVYQHCDKMGALRIYTTRAGGELVGYQIFMVTMHPHSKNSLQANQDILYLSPAHRKGLTAVNFINWCNHQLELEGVKYVHQHISVNNDFGKILDRLGYKLADKVYTKKLEVA